MTPIACAQVDKQPDGHTFLHSFTVFPALEIHGIVFCLVDLKGTESPNNNLEENLLYMSGINTVNL